MSQKQKPIVGIVIAVIAAILSFASISFAGPQLNMEEGLWEITIKMEMPGMAMSMPPRTHTECITNEDLVPRGSEQGEECKISDIRLKGNTVTWTMECNNPEGKARATGEITYNGDTLEGTIKMTMQGMAMTQRLSGRRIGDCTR